MKNFKILYFLITYITLMPFLVEAKPLYPSTLWNSPRITETLQGIRVGAVIDSAHFDLVTLSSDKLTIYRKQDANLSKLIEVKAKSGQEWIKMDLFDVNEDGIQEILVSGFHHGRLQSFMAQIRQNKLHIMQEFPFYLGVIFWEGQSRIVGQRKLGNDDFSGPLILLTWENNRLTERGLVKFKKGLSRKTHSLYLLDGVHFSENQKGFVCLDSSGGLSFYEEQNGLFSKRWTSGESYGGSVTYLDFPIKNPLGQIEASRFFIPTRFIIPRTIPILVRPQPVIVETTADSENQTPIIVESPRFIKKNKTDMVYLIKNMGYLKNVMGAVPSIKNTQMVRAQWSGYGYQEVWNSPRLDGAIADFDLVDWDGDGQEEILAVLLLRDKGYLDTLKKQDSLLIVLKPKL